MDTGHIYDLFQGFWEPKQARSLPDLRELNAKSLDFDKKILHCNWNNSKKFVGYRNMQA